MLDLTVIPATNSADLPGAPLRLRHWIGGA